METQTAAATIEDLRAVEGKAELVGGRIIVSDGVGEEHGRITYNIEESLVRYEDEDEYGYMLPGPVSFIVDLPGRQSFSPDVAFVEELGEQPENSMSGRRSLRSRCARRTITGRGPTASTPTSGATTSRRERWWSGT